MQRKMIGEFLAEVGLINEGQLKEALQEQQETGERLGQILVKKGFLTEQQLLESLEYMLGVPHVQISKIRIDQEAVKLIDPKLIRSHRILPISRENNVLTLAMANPLNQQAIDDVRLASGMNVVPVLANERELDIAIRQYLAFRLDPNMEKILQELNQESNMVRDNQSLHLVVEEDAPVVRMVNSILLQAVHGRCSDIHIEPQPEDTRVRFRVDGALYQVLSLPANTSAAIISRLKILSGMDIAEKRIPQDGRFQMHIENRQVDFRTSTLPTSHGEKIVMRILDQAYALNRIELLGLSRKNMELLLGLAHRPHGMVLVTGPTGSGKTTTLYSILNEINL